MRVREDGQRSGLEFTVVVRETRRLQVVKTDVARGLVMLKGAVPGSAGSWILIKDAIKRPLPEDAPKPGAFAAPNEEVDAPEEESLLAEAGDKTPVGAHEAPIPSDSEAKAEDGSEPTSVDPAQSADSETKAEGVADGSKSDGAGGSGDAGSGDKG